MDLNICIERLGIRDPAQVIRDKLERCKQLGFTTVALSVYIEVKDPKQLVVPAHPDLKQYVIPNLNIYTRLTAKVSSSDQISALWKKKEVTRYDLIALEPQTTKVLQDIVKSPDQLDILTFNLTDRLDFSFFKVKFKLLEDSGVCIEINYGPAQLGSSMRRHIICNGQNLIEKTRKTVILSSGVDDIFRLRSPKDAASLGVLFMIPTKQCHDTVYKNGAKALQLAKVRTNMISNAIELIKSE